jgi:hypothetical protein
MSGKTKKPLHFMQGLFLFELAINKTRQMPFLGYQQSFERCVLQCDDAPQNEPICHL